MTYDHDRFQAFCRWCWRTCEADSGADAIRLAEAHEKACPKKPRLIPAVNVRRADTAVAHG